MFFLKKYFYYILFLLLFVLSMRGYFYKILSENKIIGHNWDWSFPATPYFFRKMDLLSYYLWGTINLGFSSYMRMIQLIPDTLIKYLSYLFPPSLIIFILFFVLFATSFCFYKLFLDKFLSNKTNANYLPSLLFTFSPFFFNDIIGGSWYMWVSFAFSPVYLYFLFSYFANPRFIFMFCASFFLIFVTASPHQFVLLHTFLLLYLICEAFKKNIALEMVLSLCKSLLKIFLLFVVLGLYWVLPMVYSWQAINSTVISNYNFNSFHDVKVTTQSIFNILSLNGYLNRNMYYFSLPEFLKLPFNISVIAIWIIIVISLLRNKSKQFLSVFAIFLLLVFFIKGGNPPFGEITMWFFYKFPIFKLYRGPQHLMYIVAFLVPLLVALSIKNNKILKTVYLKLFFLVFILIWTAGWWYSGDIGHKSLSAQNRDHIDFYKLSPGLAEVYHRNETLNLNQRFLFLPSVFSPIYLANEYQGQAQGGMPEYVFLKNPTFTSESNKFSDFIDTAFCKGMDFDFLNYLSLFNFGHLVLRTDIVPIHTTCRNIWQADVVHDRVDKLSLSKNIIKKSDKDYIELYKNDAEFFLPRYYTPKNIIVTSAKEDFLSEIVSNPDYQIRSAVYFRKDDRDKIDNILSSFKKYEINRKELPELTIPNASFEEGLWQGRWHGKPGDCSDQLPGKPDINMRLVEDATDGRYSLELGSKNHYACMAGNFSVKLKKDKVYIYSFDYKNIKGNNVQYYYNLIGKEKFYPVGNSININKENHSWNHYEISIKPVEDIDKIELFFYAPSDGKIENINRFDNVKLYQVDSLSLSGYYKKYSEVETPILEFKKINPTKYRVRVHGASDNFPLVFSESFHEGWKAYVMKSQIPNTKSQTNPNSQISNYKILDGNEDDQASKEELAEYINNGWVTDLGDGKEKKIEHKKWEDGKEELDYVEKYNIDFVSKNLQDTIQNDNLPGGRFYETWMAGQVESQKSVKSIKSEIGSLFELNENVIQLPEENHLMANGYANSWIIDPSEVCKAESQESIKSAENSNGFCVRNLDGSYDFEMVVEFWPQRLFYIGLFVSGTTLLCCLGYLLWDWRRKSKVSKVKSL